MFGTIIKTKSNGTLYIEDKYFALCPELFAVYKEKHMGSKMLQYIVNMYDYNSIYRHLAFDVRQEEVCEAIWGKKTNPRLKHELVQKAIALYEYVQYDPLKDQYQAMVTKNKRKVEIYNLMEVDEKNFSTINDYETKMQKSTEGLEKLKERIEAQDEEREIMGNHAGNLSYVEEMLLKRQRENANT
jgi:hypothetical protein